MLKFISNCILEGSLPPSDCEKEFSYKWLDGSTTCSFYIGDSIEEKNAMQNFLNGRHKCYIDYPSFMIYLQKIKRIIPKFSHLFNGGTHIIENSIKYFSQLNDHERYIYLSYTYGDRYLKLSKQDANVKEFKQSLVANITYIKILKNEENKYIIFVSLLEDWRKTIMKKTKKCNESAITSIFNQFMEDGLNAGKNSVDLARLFGIKYKPLIINNSINVENVISNSSYSNEDLLEDIYNGMILSDDILWESDDYEDLEYKFLPKREKRTSKIHPLNSIIYGAPGTGKTYSTAKIAVAIIENKKIDEIIEDRKAILSRYKQYQRDGQIIFTTFHQNYGYEDFVQGLRPIKDNNDIIFENVDGIFKSIANKALDKDKNYVIIIDEINRANMSKVLGELITLIEEDKRWGEENEMSITLPSGDIFTVPNNLYIVGTMNSADKSISIIDVALRRRFEFIEQTVDSGLIENEKLKSVLDKINNKLIEENGNTDLLIGHAYFINKSEEELEKILNREIIPLLYEYFFDDSKKVKNVVNLAIENTFLTISNNPYGRIKVIKSVSTYDN